MGTRTVQFQSACYTFPLAGGVVVVIIKFIFFRMCEEQSPTCKYHLFEKCHM